MDRPVSAARRWALYTTQEGRFDSSEGSPAAAPSLAVACVAQEDGAGGVELVTGDYYCWNAERGAWEAFDLLTLVCRLAMRAPLEAVGVGATVGSHVFERVCERARRDPFVRGEAP